MPMMRRCETTLLVLVIVAGSLAAQRKTEKFDSRWRFHLGDAPGAQNIAFDDAAWRSLDLPHDWSIEGEFSEQNPAGVGGGALPGGVGWYRKAFTVPAADSGKVVFVEFDGVYRNSEVWINGQYLGKRPYGYSSFRYELTPHLHYRVRNVIAVRVDNSQQPNSRWYSGSDARRRVGDVHHDAGGEPRFQPGHDSDDSRQRAARRAADRAQHGRVRFRRQGGGGRIDHGPDRRRLGRRAGARSDDPAPGPLVGRAAVSLSRRIAGAVREPSV